MQQCEPRQINYSSPLYISFLMWKGCVCVLSHVQLFAPPWTHQAHLSMAFARQEYWSRLPFLPKGFSQPTDGNCISWVSCTGRQILIHTHIHTHNGILLSHKKWNNNICSNTDAPSDYHTRRNKAERERQILCDITHMWNLKYDTNQLIYETETDSGT